MLDARISPTRGTAGVAAVATLILAATLVYFGTLGYFFAQDDFAGLARARDLLPRLEGPWRYLSGQVYFDVMGSIAGLDAFPYRLVSLVTHVVGSLLVAVLLGRFVSAPAAWLGAVFYAAHPTHYTAVYSVSGIGELLAAAFAVATLVLIDAPGSWRWTALPMFALSLGCKETTLLLPLAALVLPAPGGQPPGIVNRARWRDPVWIILTVMAGGYAVALGLADPFGVGSGLEAAAPYALRFDGTILGNLFSYLGWTTNMFLPTVSGFTDRIDPPAYPWGVLAAALGLAGVLVPALARRGAVFGAAWYLLALLPVLPLANHTYHYYLVTPLVGAAAWVAAAFDAVTAPRPISEPVRHGGRGRPGARRASLPRATGGGRYAVAAVLGGLVTLNGFLLVRKIETYPFVDPDLRSDATVDRARIARNVSDDLRTASLPPGTVLRFWSPASIDRAREQGQDPTVETYWERNVRDALLDGVGVRAMFPHVARVEFTRTFEPAGDSVRYAVYRPDGHLRVASTAELDSVLRQVGVGV